jgi:CRP/FNR family transcriptional regulator, cyclic AMP receptor protein
MNGLETVLATHAFTSRMNSRYIRKLSECASYLEIQAGQYVFRQGEVADVFYLILDGAVEIELFSSTGGPVVLQKIEVGSALGWSWLVPPCRWRFDARVVKPLKALKIDAKRLRILMQEEPAFGFEILERFLQILGERLESERMSLIGLYAAHS